jgi:hypothetical protein
MFGRPKSLAIEFSLENTSREAVEYKMGDKSYTLEPRFTRTHTLCRPSALTFTRPESLAKTEFHPKSGDHLVVRMEQGKWSVSRKP